MIKYKLSEIAKNLNVTSKEVSEVLKNYLNVNKKSGGVLTEQELNIIFEHFTIQMWDSLTKKPYLC